MVSRPWIENYSCYRTIDYVLQKRFTRFMKKVTENRRKGNQNPEQALLAEVLKLMGNSSYGKLIEASER